MTNSVNEIALALRDEITTCGVKFLDQSGFASGKAYTYLTSVELKEGDRVVVKANGRFAICEVIRYDGDAPIIDDNHEYQFIVQKIDATQSQLAQDEYNALKSEIRRRMIKARRRQIKDQILLGNEELKSLCKIEITE
jgi:hypothetical protein